jgi:hypothetical protein
MRKISIEAAIYIGLLIVIIGAGAGSYPSSCSAQVAGDYLYVTPEYSNLRLSLGSNFEVTIAERETVLDRGKGKSADRIQEKRGTYRISGNKIDIDIDGHTISGTFDENREMRLTGGSETMMLRKMLPEKRHILTVENGTEEFALVRIKSFHGAVSAEMAIEPRATGSVRLPDGNYFEIVRFGKKAGSYRFAKGEGFLISAPSGQYMETTLTLHPTPEGRYSTSPATEDDF